ncbi:hypothetical protein K2173_014989 [Erythroxylum novogranatense]|uniref:50S ribosomal protein 5, chloroplastic n=1 Tax=Erythroxylum novogranatense TaxID=1862640 RepID=A0AAV8TTW2_9ROSI|nr:hypothetical protein K2173_014989 [Erythroxylum novogranatense]
MKKMGVLLLSSSAPLSASLFRSSYPFSSAKRVAVFPSKSQLKPIDICSKPVNSLCTLVPICTRKSSAVAVKSSSEIEATGPEIEDPKSDDSDDEEGILLNKLPLDSKLQQKLEHKLRLKLAKRIRVRRKKLVRKRRMRRRGQWSPSKVKKLKNV